MKNEQKILGHRIRSPPSGVGGLVFSGSNPKVQSSNPKVQSSNPEVQSSNPEVQSSNPEV
jgi:hypothetical protein